MEPSCAVADTPTPAPTATALRRALRMLLRPLVRLLLAHQVTYPALARILKEVYVDVAERDFALPDKAQTDSRVSLLTGIHRKEVHRLRSEGPAPEQVPGSVWLGAQVVARWLAYEEFADSDGHPLPLPRQGDHPGAPSFERLVASVSTDIRPRAVLDEWLRLGIAHLDAADRVCLNTESFVPDQGFEEKAYYFGRSLRDHIEAGARNLQGEGRYLDRSVYYAHLSETSRRELVALAERLAMDALLVVNRRALELQQADAGREDAGARIDFGAFVFHDDAGAQADAGPDDAERAGA